MDILLDTHVFLWYITGSEKLSAKTLQNLRNPENRLFLSAASIWEATIKYQLGKLPLPGSPTAYLPDQRERHQIESLSIDESSLSHLASLPLIHRDPFDRILVCQALEHDLVLASVDATLQEYPVEILA